MSQLILLNFWFIAGRAFVSPVDYLLDTITAEGMATGSDCGLFKCFKADAAGRILLHYLIHIDFDDHSALGLIFVIPPS
jgi:hypothetical protein